MVPLFLRPSKNDLICRFAAKNAFAPLVRRAVAESFQKTLGEGRKIATLRFTEDPNAPRIVEDAKWPQTTPDKLIKDLQKRNGINQLAEQIRNEKVVDFLQEHAVLEDVKPVAA